VTDQALAIVGLGLALFLLVLFLPPAINAWRIYAGAKTRRPVDTGPLAIAPPARVDDVVALLGSLGFGRVGERSLRLPDGKPRYEWILADREATSYAVVVVSRVFGFHMAIYSAFPDGTWIQTSFPRGEVINRPDYVGRFVTTSPEDAVEAHHALLARVRGEHGAPRHIRSMADAMRLDDDYRTRHGGVTLRRLTIRLMAPAVAAAGLALICALLVVLGR
jgi:hypothetical protein